MSNPEKSLLDKVREAAFKHALVNAVKHDGKADLKAVMSKVIGETPEIRSRVKEFIEVIRSIVEEVNKMSLEEQLKLVKTNWPELLEERKEAREKELTPLPNAEAGKVVTRFAPNPDYTIHLGNARPALLSYWYAELYNGRMILRFEDTDPRIKSPYPEAYTKIKDALRWLGVKWSEEYVQSLRMEIFYEVARELIKRGGAYVDNCRDKEFRSYRNAGKACPHRDTPVEDNLEKFDKMLEGHYGEGEAVLRVKTDLAHPDPSVRDWVAFRVIDTSKTPHPVTGERYVVWPTYNFAAGVDDHLMGVTHVLRAKEHVSNTVKQKYLYDHMGWKYPETIHFGRLSLEGVILSKSKMRRLVKEQGISPYDDPRLGTINGLKRRGILRETIWKIVKEVGIKPIDAKISLVNLYAMNRVLVDPVANRYMAVDEPIPLVLKGLEGELKAQIPVHPSRREHYEYTLTDDSVIYISSRDLRLILNSEHRVFRAMGLANFTISEHVFIDGKPALVARLHSVSQDDARRMNAPIIQWVSDKEKATLSLLVPSDVDLKETRYLVEKRILSEKPDSIVQLYRVGFARIDSVGRDSVTAVFSHD
ncbi:glutamate--tRNA ligase [Desulfurococcus mucosus]|uniref:Glutamate--tRNA ligase n=1 Tax=Desulfurococcus mucosus (strain ATCC 35584 / DSM 2162 / JCM 9187 / O7/1) TaxID=765177 RepID=E8R7H4_DESM0|nr:glutamate--tRNA ligase [Desulfurococcus mucosus]ADV65639.1 glutamyl-tRNA synthetase [Desulfurococcus mucosus DSM 2162]